MSIAYLFPGQGSQTVGMAADLASSHPLAFRLLDQANEVLGRDLKQIILTGPDESLKDTRNTQPALYVANLAYYEAAKNFLPPADFVAGHSLGEYCALTVAGVFSFEDGLKLVEARAQAMFEAGQSSGGAMSAVLGLDDDKVEAACREASSAGGVVVPANFNSPGQVVISGDPVTVAKAVALCKAAGALKCVPLAVSGAFHSPLMKPAGQKLEGAMTQVVWQPPRIKVVANVDAAPYADAEAVKRGLVAQISSPVRWTASMNYLEGAGLTQYFEIGPGRVLAGLMKKINKTAQVVNLGDSASLASATAPAT